MFLFGLLKGKAYNSWRLLFHTSWSHHLFTTSRVKQKVPTSITPLLAPETKPSSVPGSLNRPWRMWICWKIIQYKLTQKNWFLAHIINLSKLQDHFSVSFYCFQLEFKIIRVVSLVLRALRKKYIYEMKTCTNIQCMRMTTFVFFW